MMVRIAGVAVLTGLLIPASASARQGGTAPPPGFEPTLPGWVVVYSSPIKVDTLRILCADRQKPEAGFLTTDSPSGTELNLWPTPQQSGTLTVVFKSGGQEYSAPFNVGTGSNEGLFLAAGRVVTANGGTGKDISFTARCTEEKPGGARH